MQRYHLHSVVEACDKSIKLNPRYVKALCPKMKAHHSLDQNSEALLGIHRFLLDLQYMHNINILYMHVYVTYCMARLLLNRYYDTLFMILL